MENILNFFFSNSATQSEEQQLPLHSEFTQHSMNSSSFEHQPTFNSWSFGHQQNPTAVNAYKWDVKYPNGNTKYSSFGKEFYFENGDKAFDSFHNRAYYINGNKAFESSICNFEIYYFNGNKAYDGFFGKAQLPNGRDLGKTGIMYTADNVSMILRDNVDEFVISLGNGFSIWVAIGENPKFKKIKFWDGYNCAIDKTL